MKNPTPTPNTQSANELAMRNAAILVPESHLNIVVERVLDRKDNNKVAKPARQRFDAAIRDSRLKLRGYGSRMSSAPKALLLTPVNELMSRSDQLADAVLRIWVDTHKELRRAVTEYARANDFQAKGPDYRNRRFRSLTPLKTWNAAISGFQRNNKNAHDLYDVSIMLCMVTGDLPRLVGQANGTITPTDPIPPFGAWSKELKGSFANREGADAAEEFVKNANKILNDARQEDKRISDLIDKSEELCRDFMPELVFLGRELPANPTDSRRTLAGQSERLDNALSLMDQLGTAFEAFRAASSVDYATWDMREQGMKKEAEAANQVHSLIEQLHAVLPEPAPPPVPEVEPEPQTDDTTAELIALRAKNLDLETENDALRAKLFKANQRLAALWCADNNKADPPETTPVDSVGEAVARAREQFEWKELLFYLNGASNVDTEFERPPEVFDALKWLATTYRTGRMNGGMADPEHSLKSVCSGWKYAPDNSVMAMNQYPEAYSTQGGGKAYDLACHIKKGVDNKESHTIRIAWDWDDEQKMAVVGYIGKHQPSKF